MLLLAAMGTAVPATAAPDEPAAAVAADDGNGQRRPRAATFAGAASGTPVRVRGVASIDGAARIATVTWTYEHDGKRVEALAPPRMRVTRMTSDVRRIMVKVPSELFAIRIGDDLVRVFDPPLVVDTDQHVTCSCRMREDCVAGKTFRCEIEGTLEE
jgi:hypothetical protein